MLQSTTPLNNCAQGVSDPTKVGRAVVGPQQSDAPFALLPKEDRYIRGGAFQIARKMFESELWKYKPSSWKVIWIYILGNVSHKETKNLERGESFFNFTKLTDGEGLGPDITLDMVRKFFQYAIKNQMLSTRRSTRGMFVKVLNYNLYQTLDNYTSTGSSISKASPKHLQSTPIIKNVKNEKNVGEAPDEILAPQEMREKVVVAPINEPKYLKFDDREKLLSLDHSQLLWLVQKTGVDIPNIEDMIVKAVDRLRKAPASKQKKDCLTYMKKWIEDTYTIPPMTNPEGVWIPTGEYTWGNGTTSIISYEGKRQKALTLLTSEYEQQMKTKYQQDSLKVISNETQSL